MTGSPSLKGGSRLFLASILGFLAAMGPLCTDLYLPALPEMADSLQGSPSELQLSITACLLGLALGQIVLGPISDSWGRKGPLLLSLALFIITSFFCSRASSVMELVTLRFIQGLAGSGGIVLSRAIACDLFRGTDLTRFFSLLMLINSVAPIFGPVVGSQVLLFSGWQGIFVFLTICGVLQAALVLFGYRETLPVEKRIQGGLLQSLKGMFRLFGNRTFICYMLVQSFAMAGFFGYISASPFVLQDLYGLSAQEYSLCFGVNGLGIMIFAQTTGRICTRFGDRPLLRVGTALSLFSAIGVALAGSLQLPATILLPVLFLFVSSLGITTTTSFSLAIASQTEGAGSASGLLGVSAFVAGAISSPLVGLGGNDTAVPLGIVIVTTSLCLTIFFILSGKKR